MPVRIQRSRAKGWRMPAGAKYVGRPGIYGNPFSVAAAVEMGRRDPQRAVVDAFRLWLEGHHDWQPDAFRVKREVILENLPALRGRDLACWCRLDEPCHADVLLELANRAESDQPTARSA